MTERLRQPLIAFAPVQPSIVLRVDWLNGFLPVHVLIAFVSSTVSVGADA